MDKIFKEAYRVWELGGAVLWLHPKSKRPVGTGWTTGPRKSWDQLKKEYRPGFNVGVRLGTPSKIDGLGYLAVIDVDVKGKDERYRKEALIAANQLLDKKTSPIVSSGRGNGSRHYYVLTEKPFKTYDTARSKEVLKVHKPSINANSKNSSGLSEAEIKKGIRLSPAWEVSVYSDGRQVVLPPSIHPDSGKAYEWKQSWESDFDLPILKLEDKHGIGKRPTHDGSDENNSRSNRNGEKAKPNDARTKRSISDPKQNNGGSNQNHIEPFKISSVALELYGDEKFLDQIRNGTGITDRSNFLLPCAKRLYKSGLSRNEVLTVLSDKDTFLGKCAFDHAKTKDRMRAIQWLWKYTVRKVENEFTSESESTARLFDGVEADESSPSVPSWKTKLETIGKTTKPKDLLKNVHLILVKEFGEDLFRYNEFAHLDEVGGENAWGAEIGSEFQEADVQKIKLWFTREYDFQPSDSNIWSSIINISRKNSYHPVREYLGGLPEWDGVKRVDFFLERYVNATAPKRYIRAISRKVLCAMIARVMEPGIKFDYMLVLEGNQGLRKSTAVRALTGKAWFSDSSLNLANKDSISDMNGKWVMEQGEMDVLDKNDVKELKQFVSRDTDRMRPPYGRKSQDFPRQCVFIGTTNEDIYLKDQTGNRRFWPVSVNKECDIDAIERDRDQIFSEALTLWKDEPLWIEDKETAFLAKDEQDRRAFHDELTFHVQKWIENQDESFDKNMIHLLDLFEVSGPLSEYGIKPEVTSQRRLGTILRALGYERITKKIKGVVQKVWIKKEQVTHF